MLHFYDKKIIRHLLLLILFIGVSDSACALPKNKIKKKLHKAENYFDKGDYYNAMVLFDELLLTEPDSKYYNYHTGVCKYQLRHYRNEALKYLEKADEKVSTEIYYYLGTLYHLNQNYEKARANFRKYLAVEVKDHENEYVNQLISNISTAQKLMAHPVSVEIANLGNDINTSYPEYVPLISANGDRLFFTSRKPGSTGEEKDVLGDFYEDIYYVKLMNEIWSLPVQLPAPVNTNTHDACVGLTPEGENLLIFRTNSALTSGDIYLTESDGQTWSTPQLLDPIINDPEWNEPSACYSPDGEKIYFSSNRPGGYGGKDIYRSSKLPNGKWSMAMNLGETVNTAFDEDAPFIHSNGKELYFSSRGHENMGGFDVFKSFIDSTGNWSQALNLGYPINTVDDDIYLVLTADGQTGYLSSAREGGYGETDIYSFHFSTMEPGYSVSEGYVKNEEGKPLSSKITIIETDRMQIHGVYKSNRLTGKFIYLHCEDHDYEVVIEAPGYHTETIYLLGGEFKTIEVELKLVKE